MATLGTFPVTASCSICQRTSHPRAAPACSPPHSASCSPLRDPPILRLPRLALFVAMLPDQIPLLGHQVTTLTVQRPHKRPPIAARIAARFRGGNFPTTAALRFWGGYGGGVGPTARYRELLAATARDPCPHLSSSAAATRPDGRYWGRRKLLTCFRRWLRHVTISVRGSTCPALAGIGIHSVYTNCPKYP